jgi:hypothetical protein
MRRGLQAAVVAGALACGARADAHPVTPAMHPHAEHAAPPESQRAGAANGPAPGGPLRDPFVRPVPAMPQPAVEYKAAGDGLAAASFEDIVVRGVVLTDRERVALVRVPDGTHYRVRAGDRFRDGRVQAISAEGLVILPDADDAAARRPSPVHRPLGADSSSR